LKTCLRILAFAAYLVKTDVCMGGCFRPEGTIIELTLERHFATAKTDATGASPRPEPITFKVQLVREPALRGALAAATRNLADGDVEALFRKYDTDGSGFIDTNELQAALRAVGFEATPAELVQMLGQADLDHDHQIDLREFRHLMGRDRG
jgi:hypothetical protein